MSDPYKQMGHLYDTIVGDQEDAIENIRHLLKLHTKASSTLLEIACGTGTILKALSKSYKVTGLDLSEIMLSQARQKLPDTPLFQIDMRYFSLDALFDVVVCVFDSINHLKNISDWRRTFKNVRQHLKPNGIFIFDINTPHRLETLSAEPPMIYEFGDSSYILDVQKIGRHRFDWNARIFSPSHEGLFSCIEEVISETSYSVSKIKEMLAPHFAIRSIKDFDRKRRSVNSNRLYFVCEAI